MNRCGIETPEVPRERAPAPGRRAFLRLLLGSAGLTLPLAVCGGNGDYTEEDAQRLREQKRRELQASGTGPYGTVRFRGYRGLAELPYFELDRSGTLRTTVADLPPVLDIHAHLGISALLAPRIDLQRSTERVRHLLDCDATDPGCPLDLDVYINANFTPAQLGDLRREFRRQLFFGSDIAATHTIPNLLDEMDATGVAQAAILPVALGLPFRDDLTEQWMGAIRTAGAPGRLLPCASVHPRDDGWRDKLRLYAGAGARAVKLHPAMQRFFADDPEAMEVYAECGRLGLPVVFHAGRAGIEPEFMHKYTLIRRYVAGIDAFPDVQFVLGHAGARDVADAIPLAQRHPNAWLGIHGQGVSQLHELIERVGSEKLLFGSDWPFYHLAATLAKVLLVTEGEPARRREILRGNAERMFAAAGAPPPSV